MKRTLIVVDMQNDFVDGALGTTEAQAIVDNVVKKINTFDGDIIATYDTHFENYSDIMQNVWKYESEYFQDAVLGVIQIVAKEIGEGIVAEITSIATLLWPP